MNLLKTHWLDCPISTPPPLENDPTPVSKNRRLVPDFHVLQGRSREMGSAHLKEIMGTA